MGLRRVFAKSVKFTFRSKVRFFVFVIIIAIVASFVAFFIDSIDTLQTNNYLDEKGVELKQFDEYSVNYTQGKNLEQEILALDGHDGTEIESNEMYMYMDLDPSLRIFSMNINDPWMSHDINPSYIETGRFPTTSNEIMVPHGSFQLRNSTNGVFLRTNIVVGQTLVFQNANTTIELKIVGTFYSGRIQISLDLTRNLWLFVNEDTYENLVQLYSKTLEDGFVYSMSFVVPGYILTASTYHAIDALNTKIKAIIAAEGDGDPYGTWMAQLETVPTSQAIKEAARKKVNLEYAILGGIILTTIFSYLITRFRRNEIAILKAMGYSNRYVRTSLIAEILTLSTTAFVLGLGIAQAALFYFSEYSRSSLLRWQSIGFSFIINVIITLPGMIFASYRILKVSPSEAFRSGAK